MYMFYLFEDKESGEMFFVEADNYEMAKETATEYFEEPVHIDTMTEEESEWYPYDVY